MTLYRVELREQARIALAGAGTLAGPNVFTARSLPVAHQALPAIYLQAPQDVATSNGPNAPSFSRTATLAVRGYLEGGTPLDAENRLDVLSEQIELALMLDVTLQGMITQVSDFATSIAVNSESGKHIGELRMSFSLEFIETYPPPGTPLTEITGQMQAGGNPDFADMAVPFPQN